MKSITFQRLSEARIRAIEFQTSATADQIKSAIASELGEDKHNIDIFNGNTYLVKESDDMISGPLQVVVKNAERTPPKQFKTEKPDMTYPNEDDPRCLMSCNHAITPDNLYYCCWTQLTDKVTSFRCCALLNESEKSCNLEWTFKEVVEKACLSPDERILFESRINYNYMSLSKDIRECPTCEKMCTRLSPTNPRVVCTFCRKEFCWICVKSWDHNHICANDEGLKYLQTCEKIEIVGVPNCPSVRACPSCKAIIEHVEKCKHMECFNCKKEFCFICLEMKGPNRYSCGSYKTKCNVAPRQTLGTIRETSHNTTSDTQSDSWCTLS